MTSYSDAFTNNKGKVSDKWSAYLPVYDQIVEKLDAKNILEIGVQNGGSLEIWSKIYPNAKRIIGLDVDEACAELEFDSDQIRVIVSDATKKESTSIIREITDSFDLIVDDGSHRSDHIIFSFVHFLPMVAPNGFYVIEDLHASYWPSWGGGLYEKQSAMNFLHRIADVLNREHWRTTQEIKDFLAAPIELNDDSISAVQRIKSVSFSNSMAVFEILDQKDKSTIGARKVKGQVAQVSSSLLTLDGQQMKREHSDSERLESVPDNIDQTLVQLHKDLEEANLRCQKLSSEILILQKVKSGLDSQLASALQTIESQKDKIRQANTELNSQVEKVAEMKSIRENLELEKASLTKIVESLNHELSTALKVNSSLQGTILQITDSKSWKLTKPLRQIYKIISNNRTAS